MRRQDKYATEPLVIENNPYDVIFAACELGSPRCLTLDWLFNTIERYSQNEDFT